MKNLAVSLVFFVLINFQLIGQPTFQKYYYGGGTPQGHIHELSNGHIHSSEGAESNGTSILDQEGNILHFRSFDIDTFLVLQSIQKLSDNEFFFAGGYYFPPSITIHPVIGKMDSLGIIIHASYYELNTSPNNTIAGDLEVTSTNKVIAFNRPSSSTIFVLISDSAGQLLWSRSFGSGGYTQFVKELPSGDFLVGMNHDLAGAAVARLDAYGNIIWLKSFIRPDGLVRDCEIENDSTYTVVGYTHRNQGPLFMMRLNGNGDVQWCKGYDAPGWNTQRAKIDKTLDDKYVVLANGGGKAFLMKTDLNGDTLWTRAAGITGSHYYLFDLLPYSDGGFLFNGYTNEYGSFLFKTDSLGHLPCPEHVQSYPVQVQSLFPTDSSFTLTSIDGAVRHPAYINDVTYPPVTVIDGCTITQIPNYALGGPAPRIRPNPTTGRFTIDFVDPLRADSFYSIYDSMGKLLYQRPLPSGATTEEVDLVRFGKGIYLVKITDPDGVRTERVVVE